jgi:acyl carrier protein
MPDIIDQQVIEFTANWCEIPISEVDLTTPFDSIGITSGDCPQYLMDLEDSFGLTYKSGDEKGMNVVENAADLIRRKLGEGDGGGTGSGSVKN